MMNRIKRYLGEIGGFLAAAAFVTYAISAWATPDWNKPTNASSKTTVLSEIDERIDQAAKMDYTGATNLPSGAKGYNSTTRSLYTTASGTPTPIAVANFGQSNRTDVTAAGTNGATAVTLSAGNYFHVSGADGTKGAILPDPTNEPWIKFIFNSNSSNLLKVYTQTYYNVNEVLGTSSSHFDIPALELAVAVPVYYSGGTAWTWRISILRFDEFLRYNDSTGQLEEVASGAWVATTNQLIGLDGWQQIGEAWTYASAGNITIPSGGTSRYNIGDKIKISNSGTKYFYVNSVSSTNLGVTGGDDYALANAAISSVFVSRGANPVGHPIWFAYSPSPTGFSSAPTSTSYRFAVFGRQACIAIRQGAAGTSNATTLTMTAPIVAKTTTNGIWGATLWGADDNGVAQTSPGRAYIGSGSSTITVDKNIAGGAWTNSGNKRVDFQLCYEI